MKNIITAILGCNGYLGKNLSYLLNQKKITNFDYDINNTSENNWMNYSQLDVTSKKDFNKIDKNVEVIFFMAGVTGTYDSFESYEKYYKVNVLGLINLLDYIKSLEKKPRIIFPSTRLVYKGLKSGLLDEIALKNPKTTYALSKIVCEQTLEIYHNVFNVNYDVLRICVPYGNLVNTGYSYGTLGFFEEKAKNNGVITIYGDGKLRRTFSHIEDVCEVFIQLSQKKRQLSNSIYNIGGHCYSLLEVAKKVAEKYKAKIEFIEWPKNEFIVESGDTVFCSKKLDSYLNFKNYKKLRLVDFN